jgi:5'(3')-deoxyribonucleotidase
MKKPTLLIDLDCTLVDMLPAWLKRYNVIKGTNVQVSDIKEYDVGLVCTDQKVLYDILDEPGFFFHMSPMPDAVKYFQKLLDDGYDLVVVTQPPRRADLAIHDKRSWMKTYFPSYDLSNMIFCHRKSLIAGDVLFDDKPSHLVEWKESHPNGLTATIDWPFNRVKADFRGSLENGWQEFYSWINETFKDI